MYICIVNHYIYFLDFWQHARSDYTLSAFNGLEDICAKANI